jgi:two-component system, OmpR family, sensor histidine kinase MtrB
MPASLRARLLVAFALLVAVTAAAVAGGIYVQARDVILQQVQDSTVQTMTERLAGYQPRNLPPTEADLAELADHLSDRDTEVMATFGDLRYGTVAPSAELRADVADGSVAWQRMSESGYPYLVVGAGLTVELSTGVRVPSGIEVYVMRPLWEEASSIETLATRAWLIGGGAMLFALVLAILAARGVLRPVRELRQAARRLGEGELTTRLHVRGADELASVASTFNHTAAQLEYQVGELRRMEADARRFVADVSHELRTPLAAMVAVTDILDEEAARLPGDAGEAARLVSQEARHLTRLVNDLIEISRFDSGAAALAVEEVDLADAVRGALRARGWTDQVTTDLPDGVVVPVDRRRLDVIVANLVGNALRHGAPPVSVGLRTEPGAVLVEVTDHGPGLAADTLPHVFDRFYKADTARGRSEGSGLGLAIAWENARLHGGSLVAANGPDGGAVFTLRLPDGGVQ